MLSSCDTRVVGKVKAKMRSGPGTSPPALWVDELQRITLQPDERPREQRWLLGKGAQGGPPLLSERHLRASRPWPKHLLAACHWLIDCGRH